MRVSKNPRRPIQIMMDQEMLDTIDCLAATYDLSRSGAVRRFIIAGMEQVHHPKFDKLDVDAQPIEA
jgi:hypothetical protein